MANMPLEHDVPLVGMQNIVYMLLEYGVPEGQILGVRYGLRGFIDRRYPPVQLSRASVDGIHLR